MILKAFLVNKKMKNLFFNLKKYCQICYKKNGIKLSTFFYLTKILKIITNRPPLNQHQYHIITITNKKKNNNKINSNFW